MGKVIAIYIDGGPGVGLGHAARGLGLAHALKEAGLHATFMVSPESALGAFLKAEGYDVILCAPSSEELVQKSRRLEAAALVLDSYRFGGSDLARMKTGSTVLVCFDDEAKRDLPVDIVVNGSPAVETLPYRTRATTTYLLGLRYQVVRPEFSADVAREYPPHVRSILVTIGGADPLGIFENLLSFFKRIAGDHPDILVTLVVGRFFQELQDTHLPKNIRLLHSPKDMRSLMITADLAVSAGGQTLYELARCQVPTIAFCTGEDQEPQTKALTQLGTIDCIGWAQREGWIQRLEASLHTLLKDKTKRDALRSTALRLMDGKGAERVAQVIREQLSA